MEREDLLYGQLLVFHATLTNIASRSKDRFMAPQGNQMLQKIMYNNYV